MREIKFRGKRLDNGEWVYGSFLSIEDTYFIIEQVDFDFDYRTEHNAFWFDCTEKEVDPATVGQYTGLKDKNGKEIYEGDVIRSPLSEDKTRPHRIFYHTGNAAFMGALVDRKELCYLRLDQDWIYKFGKEVIGNIHDHNPEFLKGGEQ